MACQGCMFIQVAERVMSADGLLAVFPWCTSYVFLHPSDAADVPLNAQTWSKAHHLMGRQVIHMLCMPC